MTWCIAAILFIVEMNHTTYNLALDKRTQSNLQENRCFRLVVSEQERLSRSKHVHAVLVMLSMVGAVASCAGGDWGGVFTMPFAALWAGGLVHANSSGYWSQALRVTLSTITGLIACAVIFSIAAV